MIRKPSLLNILVAVVTVVAIAGGFSCISAQPFGIRAT